MYAEKGNENRLVSAFIFNIYMNDLLYCNIDQHNIN